MSAPSAGTVKLDLLKAVIHLKRATYPITYPAIECREIRIMRTRPRGGDGQACAR